MLYLIAGGLLLAGYVWLSRRKVPLLKRREWRLLSAAGALLAFTVAAWSGIRGAWGTAVVLLVVGLWLAAAARTAPGRPAPAAPAAAGMTLAEARRILGVGPDATVEEIRAAHARLIRAVHPDAGGTEGLAAQLNAARDALLKR
ncbi:MAG: molecular chaperone DnaJ [Phenylobacterium sp.]|uniref:molecular chaperone DnaJ n=1 Tax=Phenylobacterium sp. TaxID=1871053 RepID=UPI001A5A0F0F|nr:molecular chaperone DnaJ [Phenylobacterium sp.]MBL8772818.1 molecular chaperone DnaJ [Phenylobacterium sp.]